MILFSYHAPRRRHSVYSEEWTTIARPLTDVCYWPLTGLPAPTIDVRYWVKSGLTVDGAFESAYDPN